MALFCNNTKQKKTLPDGIETNVLRAREHGILHDAISRKWLRSLIEGDAKAHGAAISENSFNRVLAAICAQKIQACFLTITLGDGEPQYAGGAIELPSILTEWTGNSFVHYPAVYSEDTYVLPRMSAEFRAKTKTEQHPNGLGLGTSFTHERIRLSVSGDHEDLSFGHVSKARISENGIDNVPMLCILKKLGATIEASEGTVLELKGNRPLASGSLGATVTTEALSLISHKNGLEHQSNVFLTSWSGKNGAQRIVASFTEAISTFTGELVIRVQFTSNGQLPEMENLKKVIGSLILAGRKEILRRNWTSENGVTGLFPTMRIHALNEPQIISVLKALGAETRLLGSHPMLPIITNFSHTPVDVLGFEALSARPFVTPQSIPLFIFPDISKKKFPQTTTPNNSAAVTALA